MLIYVIFPILVYAAAKVSIPGVLLPTLGFFFLIKKTEVYFTYSKIYFARFYLCGVSQTHNIHKLLPQ